MLSCKGADFFLNNLEIMFLWANVMCLTSSELLFLHDSAYKILNPLKYFLNFYDLLT